MVAIHDAVTILYLTNPELFSGKNVFVQVDCSWNEERGRTVCMDCAPEQNAQQPVYMLYEVNLPEFQKILMKKLKILES